MKDELPKLYVFEDTLSCCRREIDRPRCASQKGAARNGCTQ